MNPSDDEARFRTEAEADLARAILADSEAEFLRRLQARLAQTGCVGDVLDWMVLQSVALFVLRNLWPERLEAFRAWTEAALANQRRPPRLAYAVAEPGWKGRLDALESYAAPRAAAQDSTTVRLSFRKNHAVAADAALALVRMRAGDESNGDDSDGVRPALAADRVALAWIAGRNPDPEAAPELYECEGLLWRRRDDRAELTLPRSGNRPPLVHYELRGSTILPADCLQEVARKQYRRIALTAPRRELNSLALLAIALLRGRGVSTPAEIAALEGQLLEAREDDRLDAEAARAAQATLRWFFETAAARGVALHPVWERMRGLLN